MLLKKQSQKYIATIFTTLSLLIFSTVAFANRQLITHQTVNIDFIKNNQSQLIFLNEPINEEEVLRELNHVLLNPIRKNKVKSGFLRLDENKKNLDFLCEKYGIPKELLAISIVESYFQNIYQNPKNKNASAGVWQMIASTAKRLGLNVSDNHDDRMNLNLSASAALRYLALNRAHFDSWELSILSYNAGEKAVEQALENKKTRYAWSAKDALHKETQVYLPKVIAMILLYQNRHLLI